MFHGFLITDTVYPCLLRIICSDNSYDKSNSAKQRRPDYFFIYVYFKPLRWIADLTNWILLVDSDHKLDTNTSSCGQTSIHVKPGKRGSHDTHIFTEVGAASSPTTRWWQDMQLGLRQEGTCRHEKFIEKKTCTDWGKDMQRVFVSNFSKQLTSVYREKQDATSSQN